ncbi:hypothetical protein [Streptomyces sp. NPDC050485]|uniref:hypothetical protein n=1 Tax=Streptomyces sp. NPDC050485 TaxID=3365617 RepID=UPI00378DE3CD
MSLPEQISPGDVVLTRGTGAVSRAICLLDRSDVSHALLAYDGDTLVEVVGKGLGTVTYAEAVQGHDRVVGRTLASPADAAPLVDVARHYLTRRTAYAHQQIVLLAVLCVTRRIPLPPGGRRMVRTVLDQAAAAVNAMAERGQQPMICSEFVYRCHSEARPAAPYVVKVDSGESAEGETLLQWAHGRPGLSRLPLSAPIAAGPADSAAVEKQLEPLLSAYTKAVQAAASVPLGQQSLLPGAVSEPSEEDMLAAMTAFGAALHRATEGDDAPAPLSAEQALEKIRATEADPNFVTPGDLLRSSSLRDTYRNPSSTKPAGPTPANLLHPR